MIEMYGKTEEILVDFGKKLEALLLKQVPYQLTQQEFIDTYNKIMKGTRFVLMYLREAILFNNPDIFISNLEWFQNYMIRKPQEKSNLEQNISLLLTSIKDILPFEASKTCEAYISQALEKTGIAESQTTDESHLNISKNPYFQTLTDYLTYLENKQKQKARALIEDTLKSGANVQDIYEYILQPAQYEVGKAWYEHRITVAQEHYCTAVTISIMDFLTTQFPINTNVKGVFMGLCVGEELHAVGIRMVTDYFEMNGWEAYYIGANTPDGTVIQSLEDFEVNVLGISTTMTYHLSHCKRLIEKIHLNMGLDRTKILVGGYAFNQYPDLWKEIKANGYARTAKEAVELGNQLIKSKAF